MSEVTPLHSLKQLKTDQIKDMKLEDAPPTISQEEMWTQLRLLGIPDRPAYLRIVGRAPYDDPTATIELARRKLAEKRQA